MNRSSLLCILLVLVTNAGLAQFQIEVALPNLTFTLPVDLQHPPDGSNWLFVVDQEGRIYGFDNDPNVAAKQVFLDMGGADRLWWGAMAPGPGVPSQLRGQLVLLHELHGIRAATHGGLPFRDSRG